MYAKPRLHALDLETGLAGCCRVFIDDTEVVNTGICPFPTCRIVTPLGSLPCTVSVGPVTVSGT